MRIGELAQRAGVSTRALRYYEQQGLLAARRSSNGYREYEEQDVLLVQEIRRLLDNGFTLADTRPFVACLRAGHKTGGSCPESVAVYQRKLAELDTEIRTLLKRRATLTSQLADACPNCTLRDHDANPDQQELHRDPPVVQARPGRILGRLVPTVQNAGPNTG